jgi:hypothetical protein
MAEVHEYVVFRFRESVAREEQIATMRALDPYIAALDGFGSREYFFSEAEARWIDHIVWASMEDALASERVLEDPGAAALFERFDPLSVVFGRYERVEPQA